VPLGVARSIAYCDRVLTHPELPRRASPKADRVSFYAIRVAIRILFDRSRGRRARQAILFTLMAIVCCRVGYYILLPGMDWNRILEAIR